MKKISIFLAPIIILAGIYGCSKDHEAPTFSQYENVSEPTEVVATYVESTDEIEVTWAMEETDGVENYLVAWSDSNVFDDGKKAEKYVKDFGDVVVDKEIALDATDVLKNMDLVYADLDSFIVYFTVSAVYNNDDFNYFIGPRAIVDKIGTYADSALILR